MVSVILCNEKICDKINALKSTLPDLSKVKKHIRRMVNYLGSKGLSNVVYNYGDVISHNGKVYISKQDGATIDEIEGNSFKYVGEVGDISNSDYASIVIKDGALSINSKNTTSFTYSNGIYTINYVDHQVKGAIINYVYNKSVPPVDYDYSSSPEYDANKTADQVDRIWNRRHKSVIREITNSYIKIEMFYDVNYGADIETTNSELDVAGDDITPYLDFYISVY